MPRLAEIDLETVNDEKTKQKLAQAKEKLGSVPNIIKGMANSSAALGAYLSMSGELAEGELTPVERESIALRVAHLNECGYCSAAHTAIGQSVSMSKDEIKAARKGEPQDEKIQALLSFTEQLVSNRGFVKDDQLQAVKSAGYSDGQVAETVAAVALNIYTNYFNHVNDTSVDFPAADDL